MPDGKWVSKANLQTFWQMIRSKVLPTMIGDTVTTWLTEHVDPVGSAVVVDDTLTIQGAAADAKKTGDEISGLKEDFNSVDDTVNFTHAFINYNYEKPYYQAETPGGSWKTAVGIDRHRDIITLNRSTQPSGRTVVKISGEVNLATTNDQIKAWTDGLSLKTGHRYMTRVQLLSGSSVYDSTVGDRVPPCSVYPSNTASALSVAIYSPTQTTIEFIAESQITYNLAINIANGKYTFTNAKLLVTLIDLTESKEFYSENKLEGLSDNVSVLHGLVNYGYDAPYCKYPAKSGTWNNLLGIKRFQNTFTFNNTVDLTYNEFVKLNGDVGEYVGTDAVKNIATGFKLKDSHVYKIISKLISGSITLNGEQIDAIDVLPFKVGEAGTDFVVGSSKAFDNTYIRVFTATDDSYNFFIYIGDTAYRFTDAKIEIILQDMTEAEFIENKYGENAVPLYYENYIDAKINDIETKALNITTAGARFCFITDYHLQNNARNSPKLLKEICYKTGIRQVVFGGDAEQSETTPLSGYKAILEMVEDFAPTAETADIYYITGNHEMNNPSGNPDYTERQIDPYVIGKLFYDQMQNNNIIWLGDEANSFYADDDVAKLRTYYIGCDSKAVIPVSTRRTIIDSLFTVPENYTVLLISHVGLEWDSSNQEETVQWRAKNIIDACVAMNDGTSCTIYLGPNSTLQRTYDFTGKQRDFIGMICGHTHRDGYVIVDSRFPIISTATDAYEVASTIVPPSPAMTPGTVYEQCFDVVQVDMNGKQIYMTRIGTGSDREFIYGTGAGLVT